MDLNYLASKKVAILGVGIEGIALADFLADKCRKIDILDKATRDELSSRSEGERINRFLSDKRFGSKLGRDYLSDLAEYDMIFRSPGIKLLTPELQDAQKQGVEISSQIKLFFDLCPARIIGVTGTKGKGTTSSLISEILMKNAKYQMTNADGEYHVYLAGNIGEPAISLIPRLKDYDWVVLELSSFQLQDLHKSPHIAVVLNISSDHLDYHKDNVEYVEAKLPIVKYQNTNDLAVINMDHLTSFEFSAATPAKTYFFSGNKVVDDGAYIHKNASGLEEVILDAEGTDEVICDSSNIQLVGKHNLENIAAAALTASIAGANLEVIKKTVREFKGLPHRLEFVGDIKGIKIYNDSFSTNPEPTIAAVKAFKRPKLLILGGSSKGADFNQMAKEIVECDTKAVAVIGDESDNIRNSLISANFSGLIIDAGYDLKTAIIKLLDEGNPGDILILSPACASFDMFKNYKNRGETFKSLIKALKND